MAETYLGNPLLKDLNVKLGGLNTTQVEELAKCMDDVIYFTKKYIKIDNVDSEDGKIIPFELWPFQEKLMHLFDKERFVICKFPRQTGKSTTAIAYLLHFLNFNNNKKVALLANKGQTARELLSRMQLAYMHLPKWMQNGIKSWNKGSIELENGSVIYAAATSSSAIRGMTFNIIFLDEFAHIENNMAEEFFRSSYPTISSGNTTKVFIVSTPKGMNLFYKLWVEANKQPGEKTSRFVPIEVHWSESPGRDEAWKLEQIGNLGSEEAFEQEFGCLATNTPLTLKDKRTGQILKTTIGDFYKYHLKDKHDDVLDLFK